MSTKSLEVIELSSDTDQDEEEESDFSYDDEVFLNEPSNAVAAARNKNNPTECFDVKTLVERMDTKVTETKRILDTSPTLTRILLTKFQWDEEKLINEYIEDSKKILEKFKIKVFNKKMSFPTSNECGVCFDDLQVDVSIIFLFLLSSAFISLCVYCFLINQISK